MTTAHISQGEVTTYVDSNSQQIAEIDFDKRKIELGGLNNAGEAALLILKDGHGRELFRMNASTGNLTVGGLNPEQAQDGDVILKDQNGREIIRLSAGNAKVKVGGGNSPSTLELLDSSGEVVISLDGDKRDVNTGGNGTAGRLLVSDANGQITAGLDGSQSGLLLRSPNGSVYKIAVTNNGELTTTPV